MDNPFAQFGFEPCLYVDKKVLDDKYQSIQKKLHPDVQTDPFQVQAAQVLSSKIAKAYDQLLDPLFCLQFLLHNAGLSLTDSVQDLDLLQEILLYQEQLEEQTDLEILYTNLNEKLKNTTHDIMARYESHKNFTREAIYFSYLFKLIQRINDII